ncbi:MAG: T9SS type A sorting domain-containing protein, partial [Bacteroidales bacterium]|nr:T9SS type A sorting domain-containing protein [Bacteroidales bacterium]
PLAGDCPKIKGDQSIWLVYNDEIDDHTESQGRKLGVEIQLLTYAFDCTDDSIFNNTIFLHYDIINRSDTNYHNLMFGAFNDFDLGNPWDDYVGCDTLLHSFFAYNGDNYDEDSNLFGLTNGYGYLPPAQAVVFLNQPMNSFIATNNYNSITSDPNTPEGYYNILNAHWRDGEPLTYGGEGFGGEDSVRFQYPGNPLNPGEWAEVSAANAPNDRRGIGAGGPFDFNSGDTLRIDMAFLFARDYQGDNLSSVTLVKERIEQLRWYWDNDSTPCGTTWSGISNKTVTDNRFKVFPNPCNNVLYLKQNNELSGSNHFYTVIDLTGRVILSGNICNNSKAINVKGLCKGVYILQIETNNSIFKTKFIKK